MITYKWKITEILVVPSELGLQNVVKIVNYIVTATDDIDNLSTEIPGALTLSNTPTQSFVEYANLTEEIIVGWIKNMVNMVELEGQATLNFNSLRNPPPTPAVLPWNS